MVDKILPKVKSYKPAASPFVDDDFIDRLNDRWTVRALFICIVIVGGNIVWVKHINCWTPNEFATPHIAYANSICWLKGSYYLPTDEIKIPDRSKPRTDFISYYQWTPFILLGMTLLFFFPRFLWHAFPRQGEINIRRLVSVVKDKDIKTAEAILKCYLDAQQNSNGIVRCKCTCMRCMCGHTIAYLSLKILYVINTITQFLFLNSFLSFRFASYSFKALGNMFTGEGSFESPTFPRVTMCDFMVRRLGSNQHWYSVQCNLPFNIYNEKIFLGIWFWLIILTILNILSIFSWVISMTPPRRLAAIKKYLEISKVIPEEPEPKSKKGENQPLIEKGSPQVVKRPLTVNNPQIIRRQRQAFLNYLQWDGYLIFRLIGRNTNDATAAHLLSYLDEEFQLKENSSSSV